MTTLSSWLWGSSQLDDAIDKATSELVPAGTEDIALNLEISDQIRSKSVPAKDAMRSLKRRLDHKNPNVQLSALTLIDLCVKNSGDHFLAEIASKEFMDNLVSILKYPGLNHQVKSKILRLIQNWASSLEGKPLLGYVGQVYKILKTEGFTFPPPDTVATSSAMIDTQTAPEWIDSDVCMRCRTAFTFTNRKHHCRNCGQVFDQQCTSKVSPLPHFGITQEVRVCDGCYVKLTKNRDKPRGDDSSKNHRHSASVPNYGYRNARELADAELQRAIQLSLEEAGMNPRSGYVPSQPPPTFDQPVTDRSTSSYVAADDDDDPDLKAAIEASLLEANAPKPSAPLPIEPSHAEVYRSLTPSVSSSFPTHTARSQGQNLALPNYNLDPLESDAIMTFSQTVEQVHSQGGRDITRYPALNQLYDQANGLRPKLVMSLDDTSKREQLLTEMHDKLSQAVRIYDNLLTEQVVHPAWRSAQLARSGTINGPQLDNRRHNQYNQLSSPAPSADVGPQTQQHSHMRTLYQYQPPPIASGSPSGRSEQNWYQQPSVESQQLAPQMQSSFVSEIVHSQIPAQTYEQSTPVSVPQAPLQPSQPPPPPQHSRPIQSPVLSSAPIHSHGQFTTQHLVNPAVSRNNTNSRSTQQVPQRTFSSPQTPLPNFPVAPTSAPQSMFMPSVPSAVEQSDRQEALLIDL